MGIPALTVKRVRRGVHQVTYTDGGVQDRSLRFVVRSDASVGKSTGVEPIQGVLESMPDDPGVYAVWEGPLDDAPLIITVTARLHPKTVSAVIGVASLLVHRCQGCPPGRARKLICRFNAAAYQVFRNNFPPIRRLARTLDSEGEKKMS